MNTLLRKYLYLIVGLALLVSGVYLTLFAPRQRAMDAMYSKTVALRYKLNDYRRTMVTINEYLKRKRELESQRDNLTARLYSKKEILALVTRLKESAQKRNLMVKEISPSLSELLALNALPPEDGSPRYLDIAMRYSGKYQDAGKFLQSLEQEPMFVDLLNFNIIARESGSIPAEYTIHFSSLIGGVTKD